MKEILFLKPVFKPMIWGGNRLYTEFGYDIPDQNTGECWAISAHPSGESIVIAGEYQGESLRGLWAKHRELFGNEKGDVFPLLIKIIDAKTDLSIQVHPDNEYANKNEQGSLGKTECWYILDCPVNGKIVVGHNAKDQEELRQMIKEGRWADLIKVRPIKKGDFFQIDPGTVHAIKAGTLILETQQSSDITYRLYDYDRIENGKPRQLHIDQSIDVIRCPHKDSLAGSRIEKKENSIIEYLIENDYYTVMRIKVNREQEFIQDKKFLNVSIIDGTGWIDGTPIKKGDHFILTYGYGAYKIKGNITMIASHI